MAFHIARFIRSTPSSSLKSYFDSRGIFCGPLVDWTAKESTVAQALTAAVEQLDEQVRQRVYADFERVEQLTDETGQSALLCAVGEPDVLIQHFEGLENAHERSLWLLLNDEAAFRRAEEIRYSDYYRCSRYWDGFVGPRGLAVSRDEADLSAFGGALRDLFRSHDGSGRTIRVEIFDRPLPQGRWNLRDGLTQVAAYLEGIPATTVEFDGGELLRRVQRPALELALTYCPGTGAIEVVARGGCPVRTKVAHAFLTTLLGAKADLETVPLRRFDLSALARPFTFTTDPEDGICSVKVLRLRLCPLGTNQGRITIEVPRDSRVCLYRMSRQWFAQNDPLALSFVVQQVKLAIEFYPEAGARRGKVLAVELAAPNGCSLKDRTERERLIGEKYLRRWGLLREV